ncbi:MAG: hypothetical protein GX456_05035 [Verrucomicrobia bacterium]|nr:hypothetical protein [Verrucomicrobiota bacterium]
MPCDSVARKSALIPMVSNALPRLQWVLVGAKRLVAVGAGGREAFGVRQLAAAFFSCPNNVPGTISARRRKQRVCPHIGARGFLHRLRLPPFGTRNNLRGMPQSGVRTQTPSLSPYLGPHASTEPVTVFDSPQRPCCFDPLTGDQRSRYGDTDQCGSVKIFANMNDFSI